MKERKSEIINIANEVISDIYSLNDLNDSQKNILSEFMVIFESKLEFESMLRSYYEEALKDILAKNSDKKFYVNVFGKNYSLDLDINGKLLVEEAIKND